MEIQTEFFFKSEDLNLSWFGIYDVVLNNQDKTPHVEMTFFFHKKIRRQIIRQKAYFYFFNNFILLS